MRRKTKKIISITSVILILVIVGTALVYHFYNPVKEFFNKIFNVKTEQTVSSSKDTTEENINIENLQSKLEATIAELEATKAELEQVELEKAETVKTLTAEKSELENSLIKKTQELETTKAELEQQIETYSILLESKENIETELAAASSQVTSLQSELNQINSELNSANSNIETLTARKSELEIELAEEQAQVETLTADLEIINARLEEKTAEVFELSSQVSSLTTEKTTLENDVAEKQATIDDLNNQIIILNARIEEYENALNEYDPSREYYFNILGKTTHSYELSNGDIILSTTDATSPGIYYINKIDYSVLKLYESGYSWSNFNLLNDGNLLIASTISGGATGLLYFSMTDKNITKVIDNVRVCYSFFNLSSGSVICYAANNNTHYFNISNKSISLLENNYSAKGLAELSNKELLIISNNGLNVYNSNLDLLTSNSSIKGETYPYETEDGEVFISTYDSVFAIYNMQSKEINIISTTSNNYASQYYIKLSNGNYFFAGSSGYMWLFNRSENTTIKTSVYYYSDYVFYNLSNGDVMFARQQGSTGIFIHSSEDGSQKQAVYNVCFSSPPSVLETDTGVYFMAYSTNSSLKGARFYKYSDSSITQVNYKSESFFYNLGNGKILISAGSNALFVYDESSGENTSISGLPTYYYFDSFEELSDGTIKLYHSSYTYTAIFNPTTMEIVSYSG